MNFRIYLQIPADLCLVILNIFSKIRRNPKHLRLKRKKLKLSKSIKRRATTWISLGPPRKKRPKYDNGEPFHRKQVRRRVRGGC